MITLSDKVNKIRRRVTTEVLFERTLTFRLTSEYFILLLHRHSCLFLLRDQRREVCQMKSWKHSVKNNTSLARHSVIKESFDTSKGKVSGGDADSFKLNLNSTKQNI